VNQPGGNNGPKPEFGQSQLVGASLNRPTTLQFGPDGKLYVGQMNGMVSIFGVARNGQNDYVVTSTETISLVHDMVNHDDDGTVNPAIVTRLLTGLVVSGTANAPKIYLTSTDPRQGGGASGEDKNLDTNSGILSLLSKQGANWVKTDLVRGLSRSEENHQGNGLIFDQSGTKLLLAAGGNTNMGAPSHNFAMTTEYALSAAILEIDLTKLGPPPYDLPTLDDEDRPGVNDANDPFGGNNGKNQAMLIENGPVQIYSPGFRNPYDIVMTEAGRLYTVDNGPNAGWGAPPLGDCSNTVVEPGITHGDGLHYISQRGYFGGHPNPTRGSKANTFNASNPQTPIQGAANPTECQYLMPGTNGNELNVFSKSTNGLAEYTASNFSGAMQGDLLAASFDKAIWRITLNASGDTMLSKSKLLENSAITPLDVIAQGDLDPFPGTIWVADFNSNSINIFEPEDSVQSSANPSASFVADSQTVTHSQSIPDQSGALPGAEATLTIVPNYFENHPLYIDVSSSAEPGAMTLTNKSTSGQWIQTVVIDLSSAILPDILFDPDAVAGDSAGKTLTSDSDASLVGLGEHTYAQPQGEGYRQVKVDFEHFQPDESWQFSVDIDPSSIKGSPPPGPKDSGSINGLEMSGARITVYFSDGTIKSNDLFATTQTQTDSETHIRAQQPSRPSIQVLGVQTPGAVSKSGQTVRITGLPGYEARLLVAEGALHLDGLAGGGFELDPYEANTILSVVEHRATIGANGIVDIPITLRKTHADGGINHLSATLIDANDDTGLVSNTEILELN
jgi:glucose/arabinose dehydrogenase